MRHHSVSTIIGASVVALVAGLMQPVTLPFAMLCVVGTLLEAVFFAWAGTVPALIYTGVSLGAVYGLYGTAVGVGCMVLMALPGGVVITAMQKKAPFFTRMKLGIGVQLGAMFALIVALYLGLGENLVDAMMSRMSQWMDSLEPSLARLMLQQFAVTGAGVFMSQETALTVVQGTLTIDEVRAILQEVLDVTAQSLRLALPAMLLSSGILTGILTVAASGRICARHGDDLDYVPVRQWRLPTQVTIGALVCLITALILYAAQVSGAESVLTAVINAAMVIYATAGVAALSRRFAEAGRSSGFRVFMILALLLIMYRLVALIGLMSTLFGRQGILTNYIKRKHGQNDGEDQ